MPSIQPNRRQLVQMALGAGVISTAFATSGKTARAATQTAGPGQGSVTIQPLGPVKLHTYVAPAASALVTTQIVETPNELHVIDAQFQQQFASEVRAYIDGIGKPIKRLYLSHSHQDHLVGAAQFADVEFVTSDAVRGSVDGSGAFYAAAKESLGDTTELYLPQGGLATGKETWDGIDVTIAQIDGCEADHALTFYLPEAGLLIAQDLFFSSAHAFPLGNHANWIAALQEMRQMDGLKVVAAGHGLPAATGALDDAVRYLEFQKSVLEESTDVATVITKATEEYPAYGAPGLLNFASYRYAK